jgi:hypothetical protein
VNQVIWTVVALAKVFVMNYLSPAITGRHNVCPLPPRCTRIVDLLITQITIPSVQRHQAVAGLQVFRGSIRAVSKHPEVVWRALNALTVIEFYFN